jgi:hypothetical protein
MRERVVMGSEMERGSISMRMGRYMMGNGRGTRDMDRDRSHTLTGPRQGDTGLMTF